MYSTHMNGMIRILVILLSVSSVCSQEVVYTQQNPLSSKTGPSGYFIDKRIVLFADDFTIKGNSSWNLTGIELPGFFSIESDLQSVLGWNVTVYEDDEKHPSTSICNHEGPANDSYNGTRTQNNFIYYPQVFFPAVHLKAGTYWISVAPIIKNTQTFLWQVYFRNTTRGIYGSSAVVFYDKKWELLSEADPNVPKTLSYDLYFKLLGTCQGTEEECNVTHPSPSSSWDYVQPSDSPSSQKREHITFIIIGIILGVLVLVSAILAVFLILRRKNSKAIKTKYSTDQSQLNGTDISMSSTGNTNSRRNVISIDALTGCVLEKPIGKGHFGEVFYGKWESTDVAFKKFKDSEEFVKEFYNLKELKNHPHVVTLFGYCIINNFKYIVTEYFPEGSLKEFLNKSIGKELNFDDLKLLIIQTCKGMHHLSTNNVMHNDLAARNLLVAKQHDKWIVKVADFGMATISNTSVDIGKLLAIRWMAPEVIVDRKYNPKSDVWSFGVTAWEILTYGEQPFKALENEDVADRVVNGMRLTQPAICPDEFWKIISRSFEVVSTRPTFKNLVSHLDPSNDVDEIVEQSTPLANAKPEVEHSVITANYVNMI